MSQESAPPEWAWFLQALDQKLEQVREKTDTVLERFHELESHFKQLDRDSQSSLHAHKMDLKELSQSLQYLSHKTQLQLKDADSSNAQFKHETDKRVSDIHFATREELSAIARRLEILEKLLL